MSIHPSAALGARRFGWFSAGIAVALAATGIIVGVGANAAPAPGETTFVPITPCRLFDTRPAPDTIGIRNTALGADETYTLQVTGTNGNCTIPSEASGVAMNVTAVGPTAPSFLQVWPSDKAQPSQGSSLNYLPGQAPTPNKVDVKLGATGAVKLYNLAGSVNVLGDVVGYYTGEGLQELVAGVAANTAALGTKADVADVYTKTEVDTKIDAITPFRDLTVDGRVLTPTIAGTNLIDVAAAPGCVGYSNTNTSVFGSLSLPVGATISGFTATWYDTATANVAVQLWKRSLSIGGGNLQGIVSVTSSGSAGLGNTASSAIDEVVDPGEQFLVSFIFPTVSEAANLGGLCGVELHLS